LVSSYGLHRNIDMRWGDRAVGQLLLTLTKGSRGSKAPVTVVPAVAPTKNGVPPCALAASIAACRADHNHV
jgi:hypothetical protein